MGALNIKTAGFLAGLAAFVVILAIPVLPTFHTAAQQMVLPSPLSSESIAWSMQAMSATLALMVIWWLTEAVPLAATALLPALLFPLLKITGVHGKSAFEFTFKNVLPNYASPVVFLFVGGFLLAGSMRKWGLDRRFAFWFLTRGRMANHSGSVLFAMMTVTALISMWISNTATAAMMLPLGLGILTLVGADPKNSRFAKALMLGIAWASSIGGIGTLIGTPTNGIAVGILNTTDVPGVHAIGFLDWMKIGVPMVILALPVAWLILMRFYPPEIGALSGGKARFEQELERLGGFSRGELGTIAVFGLAVVLWVSNPFWQTLLPARVFSQLAWVDEYLIGLGCGMLLFFIPIERGKFLLDWEESRCVDWGTLILFGGGIALSDGMFKTGLAQWIATSTVGVLGTPSTAVLVIGVVLLIDFLTEVTSNTAVTSMMVPVVISIAVKTGADPVTAAVAAAIAASLAFMMPVATPPNALVFGTGYVRVREMMRAGFAMNIAGWLVTVFVILVVAGAWFGVLRH